MKKQLIITLLLILFIGVSSAIASEKIDSLSYALGHQYTLGTLAGKNDLMQSEADFQDYIRGLEDNSRTLTQMNDSCYMMFYCLGTMEAIFITDGMHRKKYRRTDNNRHNALLGEMVVTGAIAVKKEINHYLDLKVTDEKGNVIDRDNLYIERVWIDEDGEEDSELLSPEYFDEKHQCRLFWDYDYGLQEEDGNPLKEATLRIEVEGYDDPVTIKVKYPKRNAKKTIKFKHKKK